MAADLSVIGTHKVKRIPNGESVELKSLWQDQNVAIVFFRRWGCMLCRLWAKELGEIAPILHKNNVKLIGVGVEEAGSKEFVEGKFFDGDLYYVEDMNTYQNLGFKRFNVISIITSLFWKQSREAIFKGRSMGLGGDLKGDWVQTGGALLIGKDGKLLHHFVQTGPGDHLSNLDILKNFGLEHEYKPEMANQKRDNQECTAEAKN
ncbi:prostamide/prostaglandin F synthase-like isoform X3 [Hyposmocoma kahamanoa]|uniref:prostamide/prostaglandin F synthase-like isoform X3 n=1 Tax=Hyposmocoma kahamanoa TaxID=1477025 RepID=UPI000E6D925E|nr:prostamide/prostaglandin F synthase-like isoform X3 [Hyposmocoma kahamanoa]